MNLSPTNEVPTLDQFRRIFHDQVLTTRKHALFELTEGILTSQERCTCVSHLSLSVSLGHKALIEGITKGDLNRTALAALACRCMPGSDYAIDATDWERPRARTSPGRKVLHGSGVRRGMHVTKWGWEVLVAVKVVPDHSSWSAPVAVTNVPLGGLVDTTMDLLRLLVKAGGHTAENPARVVLDAGFPAARLTFLVAAEEIPVRLVARLKSDRVFYGAPEPRAGGDERPRVHGTPIHPGDPQGEELVPAVDAVLDTNLYGSVRTRVWPGVHPKLGSGDQGFDQPTVVTAHVARIDVQRIPRSLRRGTLVLWCSHAEDPSSLLGIYLRRFDIEHTFRFWKHDLRVGEYHPRYVSQLITYLSCVIAAQLQLVLARGRDVARLPWEKRGAPSMRRVRRSFASLVPRWQPPRDVKPCLGGPGRPVGVKQRRHKVWPVVRPVKKRASEEVVAEAAA